MSAHQVSLTYRVVMWVATPFVRWWGRMRVTGAELDNFEECLSCFGMIAGFCTADAKKLPG